MTFQCSSDRCDREAVSVISFYGQPGHVHDCERHTAMLREWSDVAEIRPLPCPYAHGETWLDTPVGLRA